MLCDRREALRRWQRNHGLRATYGNLLEVFVGAYRADCAEVLCGILRRKCELSIAAIYVCKFITTILDSSAPTAKQD